jgi:hypothetical protein
MRRAGALAPRSRLKPGLRVSYLRKHRHSDGIPDSQERRLLVERPVWPMHVVVGEVLAQHRLEVRTRQDQDPIEALATGAADPALGVRFCPRHRDRRLDQPEPSERKTSSKA